MGELTRPVVPVVALYTTRVQCSPSVWLDFTSWSRWKAGYYAVATVAGSSVDECYRVAESAFGRDGCQPATSKILTCLQHCGSGILQNLSLSDLEREVPAAVLHLSLTVRSTASAFRHSRRRSRRTVILPMMMNSLLDRLNDRLAGRTTEITKREPLSDTRTRLVLQRGHQGLTQNRSLASWVVLVWCFVVEVPLSSQLVVARVLAGAVSLRSFAVEQEGRSQTHIRERCCEAPSDWLPPWRWELEEAAAAAMACRRWREWQAHDR